MRLAQAAKGLGIALLLVVLIQTLGENSWLYGPDRKEATAEVPRARIETRDRLNGVLQGKVNWLKTNRSTGHDGLPVDDATIGSETSLRLNQQQELVQTALIKNDELFRYADTNRVNLTIFATVYQFRPRESFALLSWILTGADVIVFIDDPTDMQLDPVVQQKIDTLQHKPRFIDAPGPRLEFPLLNATFLLADELASTRWVCYLNADIVVPPFFGNLTRFGDDLNEQDVVFSGGRFDCSSTSKVFELKRVDLFYFWRNYGCRFHGWGGKDYFMFYKGFFARQGIYLPPFRLGVDMWDNWLLDRLNRWGIDASPLTPIVHLDHPSRSGGKRENTVRENAYLASCYEEQRRKYHAGEPFSRRGWAIFLCYNKMMIDKLPRQLCPLPGGRAFVGSIDRNNYRPALAEARSAYKDKFSSLAVSDETGQTTQRWHPDSTLRIPSWDGGDVYGG